MTPSKKCLFIAIAFLSNLYFRSLVMPQRETLWLSYLIFLVDYRHIENSKWLEKHTHKKNNFCLFKDKQGKGYGRCIRHLEYQQFKTVAKAILGTKLFPVVYILKHVLGSSILWKCHLFLYIVDTCKYCCKKKNLISGATLRLSLGNGQLYCTYM